MVKKYICHRKCFFMNTLFYPGDTLPAGMKANKHFSIEGQGPDVDEKHVIVPGDDPRSTNQIIADLETDYGIKVDEGSSRKEVFVKWKKAEDAAFAENNNAPAAKKAEKTLVDPDQKDALNGKRFGDCTPDELNAPTNEALGNLINARFKVDMKFAGKSKKELIEMGLKYESKQAGAKAV